MNNQKPSRGEVWFVSLDPTIGHEQAKTRPCLIISHDNFNHGTAQLHIVLPLTSKNKHNNPFRIPLEWEEGDTDTESFILCDQIRSVSRKRFRGKSLGTATMETLELVESMMDTLLNL
jgi:mRNA interferase MazF